MFIEHLWDLEADMIPVANYDMGFMGFAKYIIMVTTVLLLGGCIEPNRCCEEIKNAVYIACPDYLNTQCELK